MGNRFGNFYLGNQEEDGRLHEDESQEKLGYFKIILFFVILSTYLILK
jgi:hypothetical protein